MRRPAALLTALLTARPCAGHGQINWPPSTRQGPAGKIWPGALSGEGAGGYCEQPASTNPHNPLNGACMLFSQPSSKNPLISIIPGKPTNNAAATRTTNRHVSGGANDWTANRPWRAPGSAPVMGSGCGSAGGGDAFNPNGGWPPTGMQQGDDPAVVLPKSARPTVWKAGSVVEVAWGMWANHGGGYSYRLCRTDGGQPPSEACFQKIPLPFAGSTQWLQHINGSRYEIPLVKVSEGTTPAGSEWGRNPIPACATNPDGKDEPNPYPRGDNGQDTFGDICKYLQFPEPLPGLHGFGHSNSTKKEDPYHDYSIVDKVVVPDLPDGEYMLSWRWDCEQTNQIWQNCADVYIGTPPLTPAPPPTPPPPPPPAPRTTPCDFTGIWYNPPPVGVRVNISQEGTAWAGSCMDGKGWAGGEGFVSAPDASHPQGSATLVVQSSGETTAGTFSSSTANNPGAAPCSRITWDDGNTWYRCPFSPASCP